MRLDPETCDESVHGKFACYPRRTIGSSAKCPLIDQLGRRGSRNALPIGFAANRLRF